MTEIRKQTTTFTEAVLRRPAMYTVNGTLGALAAFLEGYHSGLAVASPYAEPAAAWTAFRAWLARQLSTDQAGVFMAFAERYGNGSAAQEELLARLSAFRSHNEFRG